MPDRSRETALSAPRGARRARRAAALAAFTLCAAGPALLAAPGVPETRTLTNGLRMVILEDHTLPLVSVSLWVHAGSKDEIETSAGYAHFLEHLMQRGTDRSGAFEYQRLAHRWGGTMSVRANYDRTYITATGTSAVLQDLVGAVVGMALRARLADKEIDGELGTLMQEVHAYYDEPSSVAFLEAMRAAFPKHPYRFPPLGNLKTIGTLKHDPLSAFYKNLYVPNNMALVLAGDLVPDRAVSLVQEAFGKAAPSATLTLRSAPPPGFTGHDDKEKRLDLKQPWTTLTFVGPGYRHPDRPAFEVLARALGEAGGSPIMDALLRAKAGASVQVTYYRLEDAGILYVGVVPTTPEMSYAAATAALDEITAFRKRGMKDEDVGLLVRRLLREERLKAERLADRSEELGEAALFGGVRYYWDLPAVYARLTAADVNRVAAKYLVGENLRLVVLVPKSTGPFRDEDKGRFHEALNALGGMAKDAQPAFDRRLYGSEEAGRPQPSAWGDPRDAAGLKSPVRSALDNGLAVVAQEDHRHSLAAVSVYLPFGSGDDPAGKEGLAYVAGRLLSPTPTLPGRGEAVRPGEKLLFLPEIQVSRDLTEIRFMISPADLRSGVQSLAAALERPAVTDASFEAVRKGSIEALDRADSDISFVTLELFREKVYAGHPYSHPVAGTAPGLGSLTRGDAEGFLKGHLRPGGVVLSVAGDVAAADVQKLAQDLLGDWKDAPATTPSPAPAAKGSSSATGGAQTGEFTRQVDASQSSVLVGVPGAAVLEPEFDDLRMLAAALTVLCFEDVVFARRAAFSAAAIPEALRAGGSLAIVVVAPHLRRDEAVFDVQRLMRRLAMEEMQQKDIDDLARVEAARQASALQGVLATASTLGYRESTGLGAASARKAFAPASAPSPARLKEIATRYLRPETWIVVKVGPPSR
ncbi:MAG: hypothetical protein AUH92_02090 [Acidobacteria bacterium 13_1_40CM_4_69_4]|nr:MAG: hypothetical protein AUH92_02090 [Acidobacteria bacterium 13_1_40CM_4_69_4]